tara:strand:+ start:3694 stop:4008 length:315 start_codon:yes stop_codon:yes gene_type:complete
MSKEKTKDYLSDDEFNLYCEILNSSMLSALTNFVNMCKFNNISGQDLNHMISSVMSRLHATHIACFYNCEPEPLKKLIEDFKDEISQMQKEADEGESYFEMGQA